MKFIREFTQLRPSDNELAGGKGFSVYKLMGAGIPIPPGFVILSSAFEYFLKHNKLSSKINSILDSVEHERPSSVESASEEIRDLILNTSIPKEITIQIYRYFRKLGSNHVAVRSSATAEDMASASWAGQLETYLNTTEGMLLQNIQRCWASLFAPGAIFYRFERGLHKQRISIAVVVQQMIESEVSGIAFSVDPVTQDKNHIIIEAGFGLGEAIVSGQITPDNYLVSKYKLEILSKNVNHQDKALRRAEGGGNKWQELSLLKTDAQKLCDEEIIELTRLVISIENFFGFPVDVEWATSGKGRGKFFILQSRPITTLAKNFQNQGLVFEKSITRDWGIIYAQAWHQVFTNEFKRQLEWGYTEVIYEGKNNTVSVYRAPAEHLEGMRSFIIGEIEKDPSWLSKQAEIAKERFHSILDLVNAAELTPFPICASQELAKILYTFVQKNIELGPRFIMMLWFPIQMEGYQNAKRFQMAVRTAVETREQIERIGPLVDTFARKLATEVAQRAGLSRELSKFITYEEILDYLNKGVPIKEELLLRRKDYFIITTEGILHEPIEAYLNRNGYSLKREAINKDSEIKGQKAYPGLVKGRVKIIHNREMFQDFKEGNILVTSMTTRDFVPLMKMAGAIVTNEGGVTCHAAIISRELKKPCVMSTKIATEVLKDEELVEVDANEGIVRFLPEAGKS
jgi:phosphoenolpyruvate synthase/pyruvate phosphate dikinase